MGLASWGKKTLTVMVWDPDARPPMNTAEEEIGSHEACSFILELQRSNTGGRWSAKKWELSLTMRVWGGHNRDFHVQHRRAPHDIIYASNGR